MRRFVLTLMATLALPAAAQAQQLKPYTVDQTSVAAGVLIYKGKSYVSLDLLRQAGATLTGKNLYLYTQPIPAGPPLKLSGCLGQKLYNNAYALQVSAPQLRSGNPGQGAAWVIPFTLQPIYTFRVGNSDSTTPSVDLKDAVLIYKDGTRMTQRTTPLAQAALSNLDDVFQGKTITAGTFIFKRDENETEANPLTRLILPPTHIGSQTYPGVSIDLTCSR